MYSCNSTIGIISQGAGILWSFWPQQGMGTVDKAFKGKELYFCRAWVAINLIRIYASDLC
jgi:hypothetical protein